MTIERIKTVEVGGQVSFDAGKNGFLFILPCEIELIEYRINCIAVHTVFVNTPVIFVNKSEFNIELSGLLQNAPFRKAVITND